MILGSKWSVPDNWIWSQFNEIGEINPKLPFYEIDDDLKVSFIPMKNVEEKTGKIDLSIIRPYKEVKKGYTKFVDDDIIFAKITPCMENGKTAIINNLHNGIGVGSTEFHVIRLYPILSRKFFFYYLLQDSFRNLAARNFTGTVGQRRVPTDFMKEANVPIPPLNEQVRIVSKVEELFSRLDQGVKVLQQTQQQLKQYQQSSLKHTFTGKLTEKWRKKTNHYQRDITFTEDHKHPQKWERKLVKEIGVIVTGSTPKTAIPEYYGDEYPFYKPTDLNDAFFVVDARSKLSKLGLEQSRFLPEKSILVTCIGATIGKTGFIRKAGASNQQINAIIPNSGMHPEFIYFMCISPHFQEQIIINASQTTLPILNKTKFSNLIFPVPPYQEQVYISNKLESIFLNLNKRRIELEYSINHSSSLKQSILKRAFSGGLVPQDSDDEPVSVLLAQIKAEKAKMIPIRKRRRRRKTQGDMDFQITPVRRGDIKRERTELL